MTTSGTWPDRLTTLVNLIVLAFIAYVAFGPIGVVSRPLSEYLGDRQMQRAAVQLWPELLPPYHGNIDRTVIMFTDFRCPACRLAHVILLDIKEKSDIDVVYRYVTRTPRDPLTRAGVCAETLHEAPGIVYMKLYAATIPVDGPIEASDLASELGIADVKAFEACMADPATTRRLVTDAHFANEIGIRATPTFIGQRNILVGVPNASGILGLVGSL